MTRKFFFFCLLSLFTLPLKADDNVIAEDEENMTEAVLPQDEATELTEDFPQEEDRIYFPGEILEEFKNGGYICQVRYIDDKTAMYLGSTFDTDYASKNYLYLQVFDSPDKRNVIWWLDKHKDLRICRFRIDESLEPDRITRQKDKRLWLYIEQDGNTGWLNATDYLMDVFTGSDLNPFYKTFTYNDESMDVLVYEVHTSLDTYGGNGLYAFPDKYYIKSIHWEEDAFMVTMLYLTYVEIDGKLKPRYYVKDEEDGQVTYGWCFIGDGATERGGPNYMDYGFEIFCFFAGL